MKIQCNDKRVEIVAKQFDDALRELGYADSTIATALNGEFVPKSLRAQTTLQEGDCIDIVAPMQGG